MKTDFNVSKSFPIFNQQSQTRNKLVYLDNAATTHKPQSVINAMSNFYATANATVHRALYPLGEQATIQYEAARANVAQFINACEQEIVFTKGTTESINFIAVAWARNNLKLGDEIVLTQAEHHANLLPWQWVAQQTGARLIFIPIDKKDYTLINPQQALSPRIKLVAVSLSSNVVGPIWDSFTNELSHFINKAKQLGAYVLVDAAQAVAHQNVDVQQLGADFVAFSGHKMFGPTGIGILYINKQLHDVISPYQFGGSMVNEVRYDHATWAKAPHKFEAGTPPIAQAIGLSKAIDFIKNRNFNNLEHYEADLCRRLIDGLGSIAGVTIVGNKERLAREGHVVALAFDGVHPHDIATYLGYRNIAVRAGHFCAQPLVLHLGFESLLRVSFAAYNTMQDVDIFLQALKECIDCLKNNLK